VPVREAILWLIPPDERLYIDPEKIDAAVKNERDRIVVALRRLAARIG
jgi:hypothetical protein